MKQNVSTIRRALTTLLLAGAATYAAMPSAGLAGSCDSSGSVADLHKEWILVGWDKKAGDPPFDFRSKLGKYYDLTSPDVLLYDDFEPQHRVARSADEYGSFWAQPFTQLRSARHSVVDGPAVVAGKDLATSALEFAAALETADGKIIGIRARSTLVWRCHGDGWKIVREHNSSRPVSESEVEKLLLTGLRADGLKN